MDILQASGARRPQDGLATVPPDNRVTPIAPAEVVAPYTYTAKVIGYLGSRLEEATMPLQEAAGAQAVTMDAEGNVQVNRRWGEFTAGDRAYNHAAQTAGLALARTKVSTDLTKLRLEYDGRPDEFQKAAEAYVRNVGKGGDKLLRPLIQQEAGSVAGQLARGLMVDKERTDMQRFANDLKAREDYLTEQLESLAEQSGTGTEEFKAKLQELTDLRAQRAANPKFAYSPDQASIDNARTGEDLKALAIVGEYRRKYLETGDLAGTLKEAEERLNSSDLNLTPDQRAKYLGAITARTSAAAAVRQETIRQHVEKADLLITALNNEDKVDPRTIDETVATLRRYKQYSKIKDLETARVVNEIAPVLRSGTTGERTAAMAKLRNAAASGSNDGYSHIPAVRTAYDFFVSRGWTPEQAAGIVGNLLHESGMNPTITGDNGSAFGIAQWREDRRMALINYAKSKGVSASDIQTQLEFVDHELRTSHREAGDLLRSSATARDAAAIFVTKFEKPKNSELGAEASHGWKARLANSENILSGIGGAATGGPIYAAAVKQLQAKFNAEVETAWNKVKAAWDNGQQPTPDEIQNVVAMAELLSDPKKRQEIAERFEREAALERVDNASVVQVRAAVDELKRAAERGELGPAQRALAEGLAKREEILTRKLREDPLSLAGTGPLAGEIGTGLRESIGPLRFDNPEMLSAQLRQRAVVARTVSAFHQEPIGSVLRPEDVPQVRQMLQSGDAGTVATFFGAINGLDEDVLFATLADKKLAQTVEGLAKTTDYPKYTAAMSGMDQLLRRNQGLFVQTFGPDAVAKVNGWQSRLAWETPDEGAKRLAARSEGRNGKIAEEMRSEASEEARKRTVDDIVKDMGASGWFSDTAPVYPMSRIALQADYRQMLEDAYVETGDLDAAHKTAITLLGTVWKVSSTNGGRLMKHAPEQYYPTVDRSHDWMAKQVQDTIRARVGEPEGPVYAPDGSPVGGNVLSLGNIPYTLVSTPETQADIAAKRPPRYQVVYTNPTTGRRESFDVQFNVDQAMAPVRERLDTARAREEKRRPLVEGARREFERLNEPLDVLNRQREEPLP